MTIHHTIITIKNPGETTSRYLAATVMQAGDVEPGTQVCTLHSLLPFEQVAESAGSITVPFFSGKGGMTEAIGSLPEEGRDPRLAKLAAVAELSDLDAMIRKLQAQQVKAKAAVKALGAT